MLWLFLNWYARCMRRQNLRKEERSVWGALGCGDEFEAFLEKGYLVVGDDVVGEVDDVVVVLLLRRKSALRRLLSFFMCATAVVSVGW